MIEKFNLLTFHNLLDEYDNDKINKQEFLDTMELYFNCQIIPNSIFLQVVCDITSEITAEKFNHKESVWNESEQSYNYTEEAQDFFNNKYDEIEHLLISQFKIKVDMINQ
jgi:hypothetical protein